jgi:TonB family protein
MISKKFIFLFVSITIIFNLFPTALFAQKKRTIKSNSAKTQSYNRKFKKKIRSKKFFSLGVINGRVINLVRPEFPEGAKAVGARGTVTVEVLIDENGDVISAKALRGNPLLIANSINAAKLSKFVPFALESGNFIKVSGVILYNYTQYRLNWLEIGYCFEIPNYIYSDKLEKFLPLDFDEEKQLLAQLTPMPLNERNRILQTVSSLIDSRLISDSKNSWLFSLGKELGKLSNSYWNDKTESLNNIQNLLFTIPATVSPNLKISLEKLISSSKKNPDEFNVKLTSLVERLYGLGN